MNDLFSDTDLRSMLHARAARAQFDSAAVLATVLATEAPISRRLRWRRPRMARALVGSLAVVASVVLIGIAIVGRTAVGPASTAPGDTLPASPSPSPGASLVETLEQVRLDAFLLDLRSGQLAGRLVIATGQLEMIPTRCLNSADPPGCFRLRFQGRDDPEIIRDTTLGTTRAAELVAMDPARHPLAFRVDSSQRLVLLGALRQQPESPLLPVELEREVEGLSRDELAVVRGVLVGEGPAVPCPSPSPSPGCAPPSAWLTPQWPRPSDAPPYPGGVPVTTRGAEGLVDPYPDARSATFLVERVVQRGGQYVPQNVLGQVDGPSTVRITITPP
jgi:hypothetical protein